MPIGERRKSDGRAVSYARSYGDYAALSFAHRRRAASAILARPSALIVRFLRLPPDLVALDFVCPPALPEELSPLAFAHRAR